MVVVAIPPLLSGLALKILQPQLRLRIIGRFTSLDAFVARLPALLPDLVLTSDDAGITDILRVHPGCRVLALVHGGRSAALHRSGVPALVLTDFSAGELVNAVKEALLF
jgi:hypothetical protein